MKILLVLAVIYLAAALSTTAHASPAAAALDIVDVSAPDINCIFDIDCTITVTDTTDHFLPAGTAGDAFLQSRTFPPGEPGTTAEGLYGYLYRIDLRQAAGILDIPCITSFSIEFGPVVPLDYDGVGGPDHVFVITGGGLGSVAPSSADQVGGTITFDFSGGVCAGSFSGDGKSSFFFGVTAASPDRSVVAQVRDNRAIEYDLEARAPTPGLAVGGTAQFLIDDSSSSARAIAVLAGSAAGAFAILAAVSWYARRRWLGRR